MPSGVSYKSSKPTGVGSIRIPMANLVCQPDYSQGQKGSSAHRSRLAHQILWASWEQVLFTKTANKQRVSPVNPNPDITRCRVAFGAHC